MADIFQTLTDIPFLGRERNGDDEVGAGTYYPLALTREELCEIIWKPKTVRLEVSTTESGTSSSGDNTYAMSRTFNGDGSGPWRYWINATAVRPNSYYYVGGGTEGTDEVPPVPVTELKEALTWWTMRKHDPDRPINLTTGFAYDQMPQLFNFFSALMDATSHAEFTSTHVPTSTSYTNYEDMAATGYAAIQFLNSIYNNGQSAVTYTSTLGGSPYVIEATFVRSLSDLANPYILYDLGSDDMPETFYPLLTFFVIADGVNVTGGRGEWTSINVGEGYEANGSLDFMGHSVPLFHLPYYATGTNDGSITASLTIEEEHERG